MDEYSHDEFLKDALFLNENSHKKSASSQDEYSHDEFLEGALFLNENSHEKGALSMDEYSHDEFLIDASFLNKNSYAQMRWEGSLVKVIILFQRGGQGSIHRKNTTPSRPQQSWNMS